MEIPIPLFSIHTRLATSISYARSSPRIASRYPSSLREPRSGPASSGYFQSAWETPRLDAYRWSLGGDDPLTREIVGQLLQEIDGVQSHSEHVFLVGATNRPSAIDSAVISRFSEQLTIPLPDREARIRLLSIFLGGKKLAFPLDNGAVLLADLTEGKNLSGRDLKNWVATAERSALLRAINNGGPEHYVITLDDFSLLS